jgi:protein-L-isoaspartate(D-aspartate) O-methyltransferase
MIHQIHQMAQETGITTGRSRFEQRVMDVMAQVPRDQFVPDSEKNHAYENRPLPIGCGQTISQPYIVALMTDFLRVGDDDVVLEIGTGSGYQAAILSKLVKKIYTIEIIKELALAAQQRLTKLGYDNVNVKLGDGYYGWEEAAPFDGIIVTAAISEIPPPLIQQLKPGGRMMIPIGEIFWIQYLTLVEKDQQNHINTRNILPVAFVPFTRI